MRKMFDENETLRVLLRRRSIRRFKSTPIPQKVLERIIQAGQRAPTADNLQMYSFIQIEDPLLRAEIIEICEEQTSVREAPVLLMFCADIHRISRQADHMKLDHCFKYGHGLSWKFFAIFDTCFAVENLVIAAEALGLGTVMIGSPFENSYKISKLLKLPKGVLPLSLLCIGYPAEQPQTRIRWPTECVLFKNAYRELSDSEINRYLESNKREIEEEIACRHIESIEEITDRKKQALTDLAFKNDLKRIGFFNLI
jgi:nitroreductase